MLQQCHIFAKDKSFHRRIQLNALERKYKLKREKDRKQKLYTRHDGESLVAKGVTLENDESKRITKQDGKKGPCNLMQFTGQEGFWLSFRDV